ncbi:MAG: glycosyltransferase family 1 protein [Cyanobacteria bacterium P01_D01_bin.105]
MHIYYDGQIYALQKTGGISRYFANLISRLPHTHIPTLTSIYRRSPATYPKHPNLRLVRYLRFPPKLISQQLEPFFFDVLVNFEHIDIIHPTFFETLIKKDIRAYQKPVVITVHDMIHERFPAQTDPDGRYALSKREAIDSADAIICVSHNTKSDLLEYYPNVDPKVTVIHLASQFSLPQRLPDATTASVPYFLYVGSRDRYKNFSVLLNALSNILTVNSDVELRVVGQPFSKEEKKFIQNLSLTERVTNCGFLSDIALTEQYSKCIAFVYPSVYEGFGIPPLESMSCGGAVIASNSSSIPEVVGNAALLFSPNSVDELTDRMRYLLESPLARQRLVEQGYKRVKQFSWGKTAAQTVAVYESLL